MERPRYVVLISGRSKDLGELQEDGTYLCVATFTNRELAIQTANHLNDEHDLRQLGERP
jgi:hypothetical protein